MGSVYERPKGSGCWWIQWDEAGRRHYDHPFPSRELAERALSAKVGRIASQRAGLPPAPHTIEKVGALAETWLARREQTHRAYRDDRSRWKNHLAPFFGGCRPAEVQPSLIRSFVEAKRTAGLNTATIGHCVRLLSTFFADLVERELAADNPVKRLPRSTRRLYRPTVDPKTTPFLQSLADVRSVFLALPSPINVAFALGAFAGLRTGEVLALDWSCVDLGARPRITVRWQASRGRLAPPKDAEPRIVPIQSPLLLLLKAHKLATGGTGLLVKPKHPKRGGRDGRPATFTRPGTLYRHFRKALGALKLAPLTWYQATRHTFASLWVQEGGSIEKLALVMGHSSTTVTERYAHLRVDLFHEADYRWLDVDLSPTRVVALPAAPGSRPGAESYAEATDAPSGAVERAVSS